MVVITLLLKLFKIANELIPKLMVDYLDGKLNMKMW